MTSAPSPPSLPAPPVSLPSPQRYLPSPPFSPNFDGSLKYLHGPRRTHFGSRLPPLKIHCSSIRRSSQPFMSAPTKAIRLSVKKNSPIRTYRSPSPHCGDLGPSEHKHLQRNCSGFDNAALDHERVSIAFTNNDTKFERNPDVRNNLSTGDRLSVKTSRLIF